MNEEVSHWKNLNINHRRLKLNVLRFWVKMRCQSHLCNSSLSLWKNITTHGRRIPSVCVTDESMCEIVCVESLSSNVETRRCVPLWMMDNNSISMKKRMMCGLIWRRHVSYSLGDTVKYSKTWWVTLCERLTFEGVDVVLIPLMFVDRPVGVFTGLFDSVLHGKKFEPTKINWFSSIWFFKLSFLQKIRTKPIQKRVDSV